MYIYFYVTVITVYSSLAGQTLIIGAKEYGESHAKIMFYWNAHNFMKRWRRHSVRPLCCCSSSDVNSPGQLLKQTARIIMYETRN